MTTPSELLDATSIWELFERRCAASGDQRMLIAEDGDTLTFDDAKLAAERVAAGLQDLGIGADSAVTWQLPTSIDTVLVMLALSRLGAVQNPVIHLYGERELGFCVRQTNASMVIVAGEWGGTDYTERARSVTADLATAPTILALDAGRPDGDPSQLGPYVAAPDDIRFLYYTSGTTSDPKGAQHTDRSLLAGGYGLVDPLGFTPDDIGSIGFPFAHIGGPDYLITMLYVGFPAVLLERFVLDDAIEIFNREGVTMAGGSTAFYSMFLNKQRQQPDQPIVPTLRALSGGGAPKPPELYFEVKAEMGIPILHGYGMTECPMIVSGAVGDTDDQLANTEGAAVPQCVISMVGFDGADVPDGTEGEVRLQGPMVFAGYRDEALNADAFDEQGRFRTGDLGIRHPDGHLQLTGRLKDIIIRKGENISAGEVEDVLYTHDKVGAVAVIGLPDRERGEMVCAVVETAEGHEPLSFEEMTEHCANAGLMRQKVPERLEIRDTLPRNATLKILKHVLRDELSA